MFQIQGWYFKIYRAHTSFGLTIQSCNDKKAAKLVNILYNSCLDKSKSLLQLSLLFYSTQTSEASYLILDYLSLAFYNSTDIMDYDHSELSLIRFKA